MSVISAFLPIFFTVFMVVDPVGIVPLYISLTASLPAAEKRQVIRKAIIIAFIVLAIFVLLGKYILSLLGISTGAFYIAGGIMLFIVSLEMLFGEEAKSKVSDKENSGEADREAERSVAIFPLAIPMLAGPGTITTIILFTGSGENMLKNSIMLFIALIITLAAVWLILRSSELILKLLGKTGVSVVERIMGLLLSGLSVQFVYDGMTRLGIFS
jgi:multiple antibiotic resistance protein